MKEKKSKLHGENEAYWLGYRDGYSYGEGDGIGKGEAIAWNRGNKEEGLEKSLMPGSVEFLKFHFFEEDYWKDDYEDYEITLHNWLHILAGFLVGYGDGFIKGYETGYEKENLKAKSKDSKPAKPGQSAK